MATPLPALATLAQLEATARRLVSEGSSVDEARLTLTREHGFESWGRLAAHVTLATELGRSLRSIPECEPDSPAELARLGCLIYGADSPRRRERARAMLRAHPALSRGHAYAAAASGDRDALHRIVRATPEAVHRPDGPFDLPPLMYASYSRLDDGSAGRSARACAELLLEAGADPNVGYLWDGLVPPFTALTGAFGEGEQGPVNQPPHVECAALARALLEAGADPNDHQTLYNRQWSTSDEHLELLLEHGLGKGDGGPWRARFPEWIPAPAEALARELARAVEAGRLPRVQLLVRHGAPLEATGAAGRQALEAAVRAGHVGVAEFLREHGAREPRFSPPERWIAAVLAEDAEEVRALAAADPEIAPAARALEPGLARRAVELGRAGALRVALEFGFDVNHRASATALHAAAWSGDLDLARTLVELGADPTVIDEKYAATPRGWAEHGGHDEVARYLASLE